LFNEVIPERYYSNFVRVERSLVGVEAVDLAAETDRVMADLSHRQIQVHDDDDGARVVHELVAFGYAAEHSATLAQRHPPDRSSAPALVTELPYAAVREFFTEVYRRDLPHADPQVVVRFADFRRVVQQLVGTRFFAGLVDGVVAGACELYLHDHVAQVEHVDTLQEFRGRGVASSIVLRAVSEARAAGADLVLIDADLDEGPISLYQGLGFVEIGRSWAFTKARADARTASALQ